MGNPAAERKKQLKRQKWRKMLLGPFGSVGRKLYYDLEAKELDVGSPGQNILSATKVSGWRPNEDYTSSPGSVSTVDTPTPQDTPSPTTPPSQVVPSGNRPAMPPLSLSSPVSPPNPPDFRRLRQERNRNRFRMRRGGPVGRVPNNVNRVLNFDSDSDDEPVGGSRKQRRRRRKSRRKSRKSRRGRRRKKSRKSRRKRRR